MTRATLLILALLPFLTACDSLPLGLSSDPTLTGTWTGTASGGPNSALWTLQVNDTNGNLTGTYTTNNPTLGSTSFSGPLTGTYAHPTVTINLEIIVPPELFDCEFRATANADVNTLNGSFNCYWYGDPVIAGVVALNRT